MTVSIFLIASSPHVRSLDKSNVLPANAWVSSHAYGVG